jgi:hypothetical protein
MEKRFVESFWPNVSSENKPGDDAVISGNEVDDNGVPEKTPWNAFFPDQNTASLRLLMKVAFSNSTSRHHLSWTSGLTITPRIEHIGWILHAALCNRAAAR